MHLSVVLSNSLDEVTSMSFTVGHWSWTSLKFLSLSSSSFVRSFSAYVVCLVIALCVDLIPAFEGVSELLFDGF